MLQIQVQFPTDKLQEALVLMDRTLTAASKTAPRRLSVRYLQLLKKNLLGQRYASMYPALARTYQERKKERGLGTSFWRFSSDLFSELTVRRLTETEWFSGVPAGIRGDEGDLIAEYGWIAEEGGWFKRKGGGYHPARPLFRFTLNDFFAKEAQEEGQKILDEIGRSWKWK